MHTEERITWIKVGYMGPVSSFLGPGSAEAGADTCPRKAVVRFYSSSWMSGRRSPRGQHCRRSSSSRFKTLSPIGPTPKAPSTTRVDKCIASCSHCSKVVPLFVLWASYMVISWSGSAAGGLGRCFFSCRYEAHPEMTAHDDDLHAVVSEERREPSQDRLY